MAGSKTTAATGRIRSVSSVRTRVLDTVAMSPTGQSRLDCPFSTRSDNWADVTASGGGCRANARGSVVARGR